MLIVFFFIQKTVNSRGKIDNIFEILQKSIRNNHNSSSTLILIRCFYFSAFFKWIFFKISSFWLSRMVNVQCFLVNLAAQSNKTPVTK